VVPDYRPVESGKDVFGQNDRLIPELLFLYFDYLAQELTDDHNDNVVGQAEIVATEEKVNTTLSTVINNSLVEIDSSVDAVYSRLSATNSTLSDILKQNKEMNTRMATMTSALVALTTLIGEGQEINNVNLKQIHKQLDKTLYVLDQDAEPVPPPDPVYRFEVLGMDIAEDLEAPTNFFLGLDQLYHFHFDLVSSQDGLVTELPELQMVGDFVPYGAFLSLPDDPTGNIVLNLFYDKDAVLPETISFGIQLTQKETGNVITMPVTIKKYVQKNLSLSFRIDLYQEVFSYVEIYERRPDGFDGYLGRATKGGLTVSVLVDAPINFYFKVHTIGVFSDAIFLRAVSAGLDYLLTYESSGTLVRYYTWSVTAEVLSQMLEHDPLVLVFSTGLMPPSSIEPVEDFNEEAEVFYYKLDGVEAGNELPTKPGVYIKVAEKGKKVEKIVVK
jgi:hypothetical protein